MYNTIDGLNTSTYKKPYITIPMDEIAEIVEVEK
jgi:hypothetical protein